MSIAFFAPLKPPGHPTPSGDRAMGRALIAALEAGGAVEQIGAFVMRADPVTQYVANLMAPYIK